MVYGVGEKIEDNLFEAQNIAVDMKIFGFCLNNDRLFVREALSDL